MSIPDLVLFLFAPFYFFLLSFLRGSNIFVSCHFQVYYFVLLLLFVGAFLLLIIFAFAIGDHFVSVQLDFVVRDSACCIVIQDLECLLLEIDFKPFYLLFNCLVFWVQLVFLSHFYYFDLLGSVVVLD